MSKLIDHIEIHQTNRRFAKPFKSQNYSDITTIDDVSFNPVPHLTEYKIEVRLGANVRWDAGRTTDPLIKQVARMIENEVFGEFREDIQKIHRALWECDCDKAVELLSAMEQRMFSA